MRRAVFWINSIAKLPPDSMAAELYMQAAEILELMGTFDQYDFRNSMAAEKVCRTMVLQEYLEKKQADAKEIATAALRKATTSERSIVSGTRHARSKYMMPTKFAT